MKILFIVPYFYPKPGGQTNYAYQIALGLKRLGHDIVVITLNHERVSHAILEDVNGLKTYRLPMTARLSNTPVSISWRKEFKKILRAEKPDVINAHLPWPFMGDFAERVRGSIPFIVTYHNDLVKDTFIAGTLAKMTYMFGANKTLRKADAVIATSAYYAAVSPYLKNLPKPIDIVPPGVDLHLFNREADASWLKNNYRNCYTILFVSQMDKTHAHKGLDILISTASLLKKKGYDLQLIAVGRGDAIEYYKEYAKKEGFADIVLPGYVSDDDLPKYYAGADVLILPTTTSAEGFGMVLIEANACGTPVIGTHAGGIPQAIQDGITGLLVEPKNIPALAEAIEKLHNDRQLAEAMGKAGAIRAEKEFGWDGLVAKTESIFKRAIEEKS